MRTFNPTDEQARVLKAQGSIIVSAQAGAGKTAVLIERILNIIETQRVGLEHFLIVTFTKKAANEMKNKLRSGLIERLKTEPSDKLWLMSQLTKVASANISTMHAFCYEVLQENFDRIGRDPGFSILDARQLERMLQESIEETLIEAYASEDVSLLDFIEHYGYDNRRTDDALRQLMRALYFETVNHEERTGWLDASVKRMSSRNYAVETMGIAIRYLLGDALGGLADAAVAYEACLEDPMLPQPLVELADRELSAFNALLHEPWARDLWQYDEQASSADSRAEAFDIWRRGWSGITFDRMPSISAKKYGDEAVAAKDAFKAARESAKRSLKELDSACARMNVETIAAEERMMAERFAHLVDLTKMMICRYEAKKREANGVDYNDLEQEMLLLLGRPDFRAEMHERYRYIFFDEYQDANGMQDRIVDALSTGDNLMFVGDIKQSIYGFRRAEPRNFLQRYERYRSDAKAEAIDLTYNFRSQPEILDFINFIYIPLMHPDLGGVAYDSPTHRSRSGRELREEKDASAPRIAPRITYALLSDDQALEETGSLKDVPSEAFYVARQISAHVASGGRYRDCVILFRKKGGMFHYERLLKHFKIPFFSDSAQRDPEAIETLIFRSLLQVIDNPENDVELMAVLSSAVGDFSDEELAQIRILGEEGTFFDAVEAVRASDAGRLRDRLDALFNRIDGWRDAMAHMGLADFGWRVLSESGLLSFFIGLRDGEARQENLMSILRLMQGYEVRFGHSLFGFLNYMTLVSSGAEDLPIASNLSEQDDVVRLMTIHKSKGLQFENVFIVEMERRNGAVQSRRSLLAHDEGGVALINRYVDPATGLRMRSKTLRQLAIEKMIEADERSEEVRVLYVGLTRAISRIYLVGRTDDLDRAQQPSSLPIARRLRRGRCYQDWLLPLIVEAEPLKRASLPLTLEAIEASEVRRTDSVAVHEQAASKTIPSAELLSALDFIYPHIAATGLPIKRTVSELVKRAAAGEETSELKIDVRILEELPEHRRTEPAFMADPTAMTPTAWGTCMHRAMQFLGLRDYDEASMSKALDAMVVEERLTPEERAALNEELLLGFYRSPVGALFLAHRERAVQEEAFTLRFESASGTICLDGQIDLYAELDDGLLLLDFKTDRVPDPARYLNQLAVYADALVASTGKPIIAAYLYWLRHERADSFDEKALKAAYARLVSGRG